MSDLPSTPAATSVPAAPSDLRQIFIARTEMSSPNKTVERHEIDDMHGEFTLAFPKETRDKIAAVRNRYRGLILKGCLHFHGLQVIKLENVGEVTALVDQADTELKAIDPSLGAEVLMIPLSVDAVARGELYEAVISSIRGQVYRVLLERLEKLASKPDVPSRSRIALLELCDKFEQWNVVGDQDIARSIADFRIQFEHGVIAPVVEDLKKALASQDQAAAYVEI